MQQNPLIKEYLDILFRRKWWVILPALVGVLFSTALYFWSPKLYQARTRVQIRPQTISRSLLSPIVEISPTELVTTIQAEITSERYVQEIEDALHLIGTPGGPDSISSLAKALDRRIALAINPKNSYFDLRVTWDDPRVAASVANELAAIYIRRTEEIRRRMAEETLDQIRTGREDIESQLYDIRAQIETFRSENRFELESYQDTNQGLADTNRLEIERIDERLRALEDKKRDVELRLELAEKRPGATLGDPRLTELEQLREERTSMIGSGLKQEHPKVERITRSIDQLEQELGMRPASSSEDEPLGGDLEMAQLRREKVRIEGEITFQQAKRQRLYDETREIQSRLERTPEKQIELDKLFHLEEALVEQYTEARKKELEAAEGAAVERFKQGERFEVLNIARAPRQAFWPDLKMFLFMGLAVGGGLGVGMILLLEVFDQSFKSEEQLAASIDLPILAIIPDLDKAGDRPRRRRRPTVQRAAG
ncbi:MAG: hypothetical protein JSV80_15340 [Acidobacteriota bacterium]|nr:MAG: hypothetical protein JSV80_15340 [Acidobacteriota bacterium]